MNEEFDERPVLPFDKYCFDFTKQILVRYSLNLLCVGVYSVIFTKPRITCREIF